LSRSLLRWVSCRYCIGGLRCVDFAAIHSPPAGPFNGGWVALFAFLLCGSVPLSTLFHPNSRSYPVTIVDKHNSLSCTPGPAPLPFPRFVFPQTDLASESANTNDKDGVVQTRFELLRVGRLLRDGLASCGLDARPRALLPCVLAPSLCYIGPIWRGYIFVEELVTNKNA